MVGPFNSGEFDHGESAYQSRWEGESFVSGVGWVSGSNRIKVLWDDGGESDSEGHVVRQGGISAVRTQSENDGERRFRYRFLIDRSVFDHTDTDLIEGDHDFSTIEACYGLWRDVSCVDHSQCYQAPSSFWKLLRKKIALTEALALCVDLSIRKRFSVDPEECGQYIGHEILTNCYAVRRDGRQLNARDLVNLYSAIENQSAQPVHSLCLASELQDGGSGVVVGADATSPPTSGRGPNPTPAPAGEFHTDLTAFSPPRPGKASGDFVKDHLKVTIGSRVPWRLELRGFTGNLLTGRGRGALDWGGLGPQGQSLPDGRYTLVLHQEDLPPLEREVLIDTEPPRLEEPAVASVEPAAEGGWRYGIEAVGEDVASGSGLDEASFKLNTANAPSAPAEDGRASGGVLVSQVRFTGPSSGGLRGEGLPADADPEQPPLLYEMAVRDRAGNLALRRGQFEMEMVTQAEGWLGMDPDALNRVAYRLHAIPEVGPGDGEGGGMSGPIGNASGGYINGPGMFPGGLNAPANVPIRGSSRGVGNNGFVNQAIRRGQVADRVFDSSSIREAMQSVGLHLTQTQFSGEDSNTARPGRVYYNRERRDFTFGVGMVLIGRRNGAEQRAVRSALRMRAKIMGPYKAPYQPQDFLGAEFEWKGVPSNRPVLGTWRWNGNFKNRMQANGDKGHLTRGLRWEGAPEGLYRIQMDWGSGVLGAPAPGFGMHGVSTVSVGAQAGAQDPAVLKVSNRTVLWEEDWRQASGHLGALQTKETVAHILNHLADPTHRPYEERFESVAPGWSVPVLDDMIQVRRAMTDPNHPWHGLVSKVQSFQSGLPFHLDLTKSSNPLYRDDGARSDNQCQYLVAQSVLGDPRRMDVVSNTIRVYQAIRRHALESEVVIRVNGIPIQEALSVVVELDKTHHSLAMVRAGNQNGGFKTVFPDAYGRISHEASIK